MSDKQERYFVVSESELQNIITASMDAAHSYVDEADHELLNEAKAACRAREVVEISVGGFRSTWMEVGK